MTENERFDPLEHADREQNLPEQVEEGSIHLDNQGIQVTVLCPSGRIRVLDKVSGIEWVMKSGRNSGNLYTKENGQDKTYTFGLSGENGILFKTNFYMLRNTEEEDYHDVSLTGSLGNQPGTLLTIRYLLSNTFPVLYCFCYVYGNVTQHLAKVQFPLGFQMDESKNSEILLPKDTQSLQKESIADAPDELWQPSGENEHLVIGAPMFVMTKRERDRASSCIGYLQHPLSTLEIRQADTGRYVTPSSSRLEVTGITEELPYRVRYQFIPSDDLEAIAWLYHEHLNEPQPEFHL